ncbi:MAG: hypothetical protein EXS31_13165 [Pedosphaera sp.]|nr:hypothetical protein [Pedosphaera sp.]
MKTFQALSFCVVALSAGRLEAEGFLDRVDEALTFSAFADQVRARLSGLLDLEGYYFQQPAPGLIYTSSDSLLNPRLTLFLDAQLGSHVYLFAQSRLDRGFDLSDGGAQVRLDEYALRLTPWDDGRLNLQFGKFATIGGNWLERHLSWEHPFITAPLPYGNYTAVYDTEAPSSAQDFLSRTLESEGKYDFNPIIWGPSYTTGASVAGRIGKFDYAAEIKNAALSSRPESWDATQIGFDHPTFTGRVGFRPNPMWNLGFSASSGPYFRPEARPTLPSGRGIGDYREHVLGQDIRFAWHHWQLWAEVYEARFDVPHVGNADTVAYYLEAKYKFTPQLFSALRWNQPAFLIMAGVREVGGAEGEFGPGRDR